MQLYISIQLLDIWRVGKVDESLWYAWLLQHLNVRLREVHWFPVLYLWQWKETATTLGPSNGEFAGEGTVQKEVFQEGEEIRRGGGRSAWPGRSVSTTKDHLNHSIISIISPACCEMTVLSMALMVLQEKSAEQGWDSFSVVVSDDLQMYIKTCCSCHLWCLICQSHHLALPDEEVPEETAEAVATCSVMWSVSCGTRRPVKNVLKT